MPAPRFILIATVKGGHRFFLDTKHDAIAIADESGDTSSRIGRPNETDDGVLYLDFSRPILGPILVREDRERGIQYTLPLYDEEGLVSTLPIDFAEAGYARTLGMSIVEPCWTTHVTIHRKVVRSNRFQVKPVAAGGTA